ncbi:hypothetical protein FYM84_25020 [Pseudomonas sp. CAH-1]|uniref:hypothetical protein n=1 Tax=Pseudomonas TaxID=286 RepID=UPI001070862A|nr:MULTISPECIES: hypothetical protein [Pseudomonas]MBH3373978.1 hypothetical protein [Pseudomonas juntendi]MRT63820.1 hypothetical protein [Pseudomonas sp. CAH-1]
MRPTQPLSPVFTLIISHPLHRPGREQMIEQVRHVSELYGARLIGISELNEHAFAQRMAERLTPDQVDQARAEVGAMTCTARN